MRKFQALKNAAQSSSSSVPLVWRALEMFQMPPGGRG